MVQKGFLPADFLSDSMKLPIVDESNHNGWQGINPNRSLVGGEDIWPRQNEEFHSVKTQVNKIYMSMPQNN
jgi:hypothetical protein